MSTEHFSHDVFLSHGAKDKAIVRGLAAWLKRDGIRVWLDEEQINPGDCIPAKIEEGLEDSRVVVCPAIVALGRWRMLCVSAHAFGSDWAQLACRAEAERHRRKAGTFRFRDPLNKERRFNSMRLDDDICTDHCSHRFRPINATSLSD